LKKITIKDLKSLAKDTALIILGTAWILMGMEMGFIGLTVILPKIDSLLVGRSGPAAWFLAVIPLYAMVNILFIGGYLVHKLTTHFSPRIFEPIKGRIEIVKEGGKRKWYQQWRS
jgi:hypothetical protein